MVKDRGKMSNWQGKMIGHDGKMIGHNGKMLPIREDGYIYTHIVRRKMQTQWEKWFRTEDKCLVSREK